MGAAAPLFRVSCAAAVLSVLAVLAVLAALGCAADPFVEVTSFGENPGGLRMFEHVPDGVEGPVPLVVMLHGCTQTHDVARTSGLVARADDRGFAVLAPEQGALNNPQLCFDWFNHDDIVRDEGEAASIHAMIAHEIDGGVADPDRVFAAGLSAGAAMTVALVASYPDVVAAGASFAGGPYGCAESAADAAGCMLGAVDHTPAEWADLLDGAGAPSAAPLPRLLVVQGDADAVVSPKNAGLLVDQWTARAGVSRTPTSTEHLAGDAEQRDFAGVVRAITVHGLGHALPVDVAHGCGEPGAFASDGPLCGVDLALGFFGLE